MTQVTLEIPSQRGYGLKILLHKLSLRAPTAALKGLLSTWGLPRVQGWACSSSPCRYVDLFLLGKCPPGGHYPTLSSRSGGPSVFNLLLWKSLARHHVPHCPHFPRRGATQEARLAPSTAPDALQHREPRPPIPRLGHAHSDSQWPSLDKVCEILCIPQAFWGQAGRSSSSMTGKAPAIISFPPGGMGPCTHQSAPGRQGCSDRTAATGSPPPATCHQPPATSHSGVALADRGACPTVPTPLSPQPTLH